MESLVFLLVGYVLGSFTPTELKTIISDKGKKIHKYLASPVSNKLELDWSVRQLFMLFSKKRGDLWYEARVHLNKSVIKSLLCVFKIIYLVRIDLIDDNQERGKSRTFVLHGFQSLESVMKKSGQLINKFMEEVNSDLKEEDRMFYYQTFVAGHNVVADFMNGSFVR